MTAKQRIRDCVGYKGLDRAPCGLFGTSFEYLEGMAEYAGKRSIEALFEDYKVDIWNPRNYRLTYSGKKYKYRNELINPWDSLYYENNPSPPFLNVSSIDEVYSYPIPDISEYDPTDYIRELNEHNGYAICGGINAAIFHNYLYMCGQIDGLCLLKSDPELAIAIIDRITEFWERYLTFLLKIAGENIDIIENCNDFGTQTSTFISIEDFRLFFIPAIIRLYKIIKKHNIMVLQHSCGAVSQLIGDFIEMGADIINPIQVSAADMDLSSVVSKYKGKICFYGGLDTQYLLPNGPVEKIQAKTREAVKLFGEQGGFILSGSQGFMEDIPYVNALAMIEPKLREF